MYNYYDEVAEDVRNYIKEETSPEEFTDREELGEYLNDNLWNEDGVTGNASGSYTFNAEEAKEYVTDNMELLMQAAEEFGLTYDKLGEEFISEHWEYFDVIIRCYVLASVISDVLDEMEELGLFEEDGEEEEA